MASPYPHTDNVTGASCEGLVIAHIGKSNLPTKSHNFKLNFVLHVPRLSQHLLSMHQLLKDNHCRCIIDEFSLCIHNKITERILFKGLSNHAVSATYPQTTKGLTSSISWSKGVFYIVALSNGSPY